jgi:hypothetical protein
MAQRLAETILSKLGREPARLGAVASREGCGQAGMEGWPRSSAMILRLRSAVG